MNILRVKERWCGWPKEGGVYILGGVNVTQEGSTQRFIRISPPISYPVEVHRGPRIVSGSAILNREPMETWWEGSSEETEIGKRGKAWAVNVFGMPLSERRNFGECTGLNDADTCLAQLASRITIDDGIIDQFRNLSIENVGSFPRVAVHYDDFRTILKQAFSDGSVSSLMNLQASTWRLAQHIPPRKLSIVIPILCRVLILMNLPQDAIAMRQMFLQKEG